MTLVLIPLKLVDIPKTADLWRNFCYATLLKSRFCMGESPVNLLRFYRTPFTFSEEHLWRAASGHLHYNKKDIYIEHIFLSIY